MKSLSFLIALVFGFPSALYANPSLSKANQIVFNGKSLTSPIHLKAPLSIKNKTYAPSSIHGPLIHSIVTGKDSEKHFELLFDIKNKTTIFSDYTGPQGVDGEWSRFLAISNKQIITYQTRHDIFRCDISSPQLFVKRYDFSKKRFIAASLQLFLSKKKIKTLKGKRLFSPDYSLHAFVVRALSSHQNAKGNASSLYPSSELLDQNLSTQWNTAHAPSPKGEFVTLTRSPSNQKIKGITLYLGHQPAKQLIRSNYPKSLILSLSKERQYRLKFPVQSSTTKLASAYYFKFPKPLIANCLSIIVESTSSSSHFKIAEIDIATTNTPEQIVKDLASTDPQKVRNARALFLKLGSKALPLIRTGLKSKNNATFATNILPLLRLAHGKEADALYLDALTLVFSTKKNKHVLDLALEHYAKRDHALKTFPHLLKTNMRLALKLLPNLKSPRALQQLLKFVGSNDQKLRLTIRNVLVRNPNNQLRDELVVILNEKKANQAALEDLIYISGKQIPSNALENALMQYKENKNFNIKYRLLETQSQLKGEHAFDDLARATKDANEILRAKAITLLDSIKSTHLEFIKRRDKIFLNALNDVSPRVRKDAVIALSHHLNKTTADRLRKALRYESWPMVASAAAFSLRHDCNQKSFNALERAIKYRGYGIDEAALSSLIYCAKTKTDVDFFDYLTSLTMNKKETLAIRMLATRSLNKTIIKGRGRIISSLFLRLGRQATRDSRAELLAAALAKTLGDLKDKTHTSSLINALSLSPSPLIRGEAASALGKLCDPKSIHALRHALADPIGSVKNSAKHAIYQCRKQN